MFSRSMFVARSDLRRRAAAVLILFLSAQLTSCFSERSATDPDALLEDCNVPGEAIGPNRAVIAIRDYAFLPDTIRISRGTTVFWVNCDNIAGLDAHTTTSDNGTWVSPTFAEGGQFRRTFTSTGTFLYHCGPHAFMRGTVIVE